MSLRRTATPRSTSTHNLSESLSASGRGLRTPLAVQPLAEFLAGLEERHVFVLDEDGVAGAGIASLPGGTMLHRERAEAAQLDPVAASESAR